ncbi:hypothetical protein P167DRAFT_144840 [Morchella conica CCBAS932]|uniref:Uncharacterized protein n=1 Tax=Morchella conica CCBAS932 TaxID=1392247 RepID=A0A3N4KTQ2_9PEZI|nr:hypothetical protein P167DRAFT_144840 [Morchella conica CCBAS932]
MGTGGYMGCDRGRMRARTRVTIEQSENQNNASIGDSPILQCTSSCQCQSSMPKSISLSKSVRSMSPNPRPPNTPPFISPTFPTFTPFTPFLSSVASQLYPVYSPAPWNFTCSPPSSKTCQPNITPRPRDPLHDITSRGLHAKPGSSLDHHRIDRGSESDGMEDTCGILWELS